MLIAGSDDEHEHEHSADDPETSSPVDGDGSESDEIWHEALESKSTDLLTSTDESESDNDIFMDAFEYIADDECSSPGPDSRPATPFLDLKHPEWLKIVDGVDAGRVCQPVDRVYPHYRARTGPGERGLVHGESKSLLF
jgi:hypothetical protein